MEHINENELIKLIAGEVDETRAAELRGHFEQCSQCKQRFEELGSVWAVMGDWQVEKRDLDLANAIIERAREGSSVDYRRWISVFARVAAGMIIAVAAGHIVARQSVETEVVSADQNGSYLAALELGWSNELTWTVLEENTTGGVSDE